MTPERWQRVKEQFHLALERDPVTRGDYLAQACAGDADLRREVEALIADQANVGSFMLEPAGARRPPATTIGFSLSAGSRFGPYELIGLIGAGGMGEVYRARDTRLDREVALKVLPSDLAAHPERRQRLLREARLVSALNHPNICTIHEVGSVDDLDYICFELIEGQTLAAAAAGGLPVERLLAIALPLADALAHAHRQRILHRDLKPSNVMVTEQGPKLLDFGLAKMVRDEGATPGTVSSLSGSGLVMGTVAYMSPEQALGRKVDERSDIFSFGAVLYEMASGKQAFVGETPTEVLDAILHRDPAPLRGLSPALPDGLSVVVEKALRKEPAARYQSMADVAADLRRLQKGTRGLIADRRRRIARAGVLAAVAATLTIGPVLMEWWRSAQAGGPLPRKLAASADAFRAYVRGEALFHRVDWDGAAAEFRRAAAIDPNFALAHYRLSIVTSYLGHRGHAGPESRAAAQRASALKHMLSRADQEVVEANLVFNAGRLSEAVPLLESALARDPDNKDLLLLLSECYMHSPKEADPRRAAALMERLLALDPTYRVVYHHLVIAYLLLGEPGRISEKLDEWDAQEPKFVVVLRGWVLGAQGRVDEALRLLESNQDENAIFLRCLLALRSGRWDIVRSIVSEHGKNATYGYFVPLTEAHLYVNLGELRHAEAAYRAVPPPPPEMGEESRLILAYHGLAELLAAKGDMKAAQREAERGLATQPEGPYCLYFAGLFAVRAGDLAAADGLLRKLEGITAVARGPLVPYYRDALSAEIELARGRPAQAQLLLAKAVESGKLGYEAMQYNPGPLIRDALARSCLAKGDRTKAAEVLDAFVKRPASVDHPAILIRAYYTLGTLKLDLGDREGGRTLLQKFLEHWGKADWNLPEVRDARARLASSES